jgi:hypothetical protein
MNEVSISNQKDFIEAKHVSYEFARLTVDMMFLTKAAYISAACNAITSLSSSKNNPPRCKAPLLVTEVS